MEQLLCPEMLVFRYLSVTVIGAKISFHILSQSEAMWPSRTRFPALRADFTVSFAFRLTRLESLNISDVDETSSKSKKACGMCFSWFVSCFKHKVMLTRVFTTQAFNKKLFIPCISLATGQTIQYFSTEIERNYWKPLHVAQIFLFLLTFFRRYESFLFHFNSQSN